MDSGGKLVMESILETQAATILQFFAGRRGTLGVTCEEGTCAAGLYDRLNRHVAQRVVCNRGQNALLKYGNKRDRIAARKLAELFRGNHRQPVYQGERSVRTRRARARSDVPTVKDLPRVRSRWKARYRSWAIPCAGRDVYSTRHGAEGWGKIEPAGVRRRAEQLYPHLEVRQQLRPPVRRERLAERRKPPAPAKLRQIPSLGPIRSGLLVALLQTPHRFRTKRQLGAYRGLALETRRSAESRYVEGQLRHAKKLLSLRGRNQDHNHALKARFKAASITARVHPGPCQDFYQALLGKGLKPTMARLTLARKMAAITLTLGQKGEGCDAEKLKPQAAGASPGKRPFPRR
jgi:transposase